MNITKANNDTSLSFCWFGGSLRARVILFVYDKVMYPCCILSFYCPFFCFFCCETNYVTFLHSQIIILGLTLKLLVCIMSSLAGLQSSSHGKNFNVSNFLDTLAHKGMDVKHMCSVFDSHEKNEY